jgi:parallel beta-helix repeat protein
MPTRMIARSATRLALLTALIALLGASAPSIAGADTIQVFPGPNAIGNALNSANPGDTIRIHHGHYLEHFTINKRVRLVAATGEHRPVIDGGCATRDTIAVRHAGVVLKGLRVVGADTGFGTVPAEVDFHGVTAGRVDDLVLIDTCDAEYGVNVYQSGAIQVVDSRARGFEDAGVYIGGISSTPSALRVRHNETNGNNRGIIVEDADVATDIRVTDNVSHDNDIPPGEGLPSGIFLHNGDGVLIAGNTANDNADYGVWLDANSSNNVLNGNTATGNGLKSFQDDGTSNCGSGNTFPGGDALLPC